MLSPTEHAYILRNDFMSFMRALRQGEFIDTAEIAQRFAEQSPRPPVASIYLSGPRYRRGPPTSSIIVYLARLINCLLP